MQLYIYAKSSHRDSLESVRRASALAKMLVECKPTLCTGDYRAATIARESMDVEDAMGIDAMGNLPHTMERLDMLIYDNEDVDEQMHSAMSSFTTRLYKIGEDIPYELIDSFYFQEHKPLYSRAIFFGDEDYNKWFLEFSQGSKKQDIPLLNGNYFFLDSAEKFRDSFSEVIEEEQYKEVISKTKYLLCGTIHGCLESLAAGQSPIFFLRGDKEVSNLELLKKYNIPTAKGETLDALIEDYDSIIANYPQTMPVDKYDPTKLQEEILSTLDEYAHITPSMDYSYYYADK